MPRNDNVSRASGVAGQPAPANAGSAATTARSTATSAVRLPPPPPERPREIEQLVGPAVASTTRAIEQTVGVSPPVPLLRDSDPAANPIAIVPPIVDLQRTPQPLPAGQTAPASPLLAALSAPEPLVALRDQSGPAIDEPAGHGLLTIHAPRVVNGTAAPATSVLIYPEIVPLPDYLRGAPELRAFHPWPFAPSAIKLEDKSVVMALVSALAIMTVLTIAGAGNSGRPLKHVAWRRSVSRYHRATSWDLGFDDNAPRVLEQKSAMVESLSTTRRTTKKPIRLRRVA